MLLAFLPACSEPPREPTEAPEGGVLRDLRRPVDGGDVVLVRVLSGPAEHRFEPAAVIVPDSGTLRFVFGGSTPETIVFDTAGLPTAARDFLREQALTHGPLLVRPGQTYDASFRGAPDGHYPFRSLLHGARGMRGVAIVGPERR